MTEDKSCTRCGELKPVLSFGFVPRSKTRRGGICKACVRLRQNEWGKINYERNVSTPVGGKKACKSCGVGKDFSKFGRLSTSMGGFTAKCLECLRELDKKRYQENPEKRKLQVKWGAIKSKFGLSEKQWNDLFESQGRACAICHVPFIFSEKKENSANPCVDHNHSSNKVRGLLCKLCNQGIGLLRDDPSIVARAAIYLRKSEK
jgi:Autographiviridae endonuclease VII